MRSYIGAGDARVIFGRLRTTINNACSAMYEPSLHDMVIGDTAELGVEVEYLEEYVVSLEQRLMILEAQRLKAA